MKIQLNTLGEKQTYLSFVLHQKFILFIEIIIQDNDTFSDARFHNVYSSIGDNLLDCDTHDISQK